MYQNFRKLRVEQNFPTIINVIFLLLVGNSTGKYVKKIVFFFGKVALKT